MLKTVTGIIKKVHNGGSHNCGPIACMDCKAYDGKDCSVEGAIENLKAKYKAIDEIPKG